MSKTTICQNCNRRLEAQRSTRRYCSDACRQAAQRSRDHERARARGIATLGIEDFDISSKVSDDLNGRLRPWEERDGERAPWLASIPTSGPVKLYDEDLNPEKRRSAIRHRTSPAADEIATSGRRPRAISRDDAYLRDMPAFQGHPVPPLEDDRTAVAKAVTAEVSKQRLRLQTLAGVALHIPSLVNEPEVLRREFGLEPDVLREFLDIEHELLELDAEYGGPEFREKRRRRRESPGAQANLQGYREREAIRELAARFYEKVATLTVTASRAGRESDPMKTIARDARDELVTRDAERLLEIISQQQTQLEEAREIALRLLDRVPGSARLAAAVDAFLEQAHAQAA